VLEVGQRPVPAAQCGKARTQGPRRLHVGIVPVRDVIHRDAREHEPWKSREHTHPRMLMEARRTCNGGCLEWCGADGHAEQEERHLSACMG
jgi:hypothetical protein